MHVGCNDDIDYYKVWKPYVDIVIMDNLDLVN